MQIPWWSNAVVYQIYPRSFCDSDGDGIGDLQGIVGKLDYLADLGVDVVWLSPVYASPQDDNGYDISDYDAIDPVFGTMADFDALVAGLHERGIKLVMDLVVNHTSDEHAWFVESRDPHSPKRDWYYWRPPREGCEPGTPGAEPTNWGSFFGGSGWTYDEASGEYYLHLFSHKQPDLNWENPEVRQAVYAMMNRWVARGVDGFRMDVINLISKTLPLTDGHRDEGAPYSYEVERVTNGPRLLEFIEEMNAAVGIDARGLFTVGEMVLCDAEHARRYTSRAHPRLGMVFTFEHMSLDQGPLSKFDLRSLHLPDLKKNLAHWQAALAGDGWNSLYWENHDQPRVVSRFGDDSPGHRVAAAKAWATVLHLHQGTPYIYQGEEIGMTNAGFTRIEQYRDIESVNHYHAAVAAGADPAEVLAGLAVKSRDNARTPIPWSPDAPHHGFTSGTPWLPLNANSDTINVQAALSASDGVREHYKRLIALRHESDVVQRGAFELLLPEHEKLWAFTRTLTSERLLVVANMSSEASGVPLDELPDLAGAEVILGGNGGDIQTLDPWEARVYRIRT